MIMTLFVLDSTSFTDAVLSTVPDTLFTSNQLGRQDQSGDPSVVPSTGMCPLPSASNDDININNNNNNNNN